MSYTCLKKVNNQTFVTSSKVSFDIASVLAVSKVRGPDKLDAIKVVVNHDCYYFTKIKDRKYKYQTPTGKPIHQNEEVVNFLINTYF